MISDYGGMAGEGKKEQGTKGEENWREKKSWLKHMPQHFSVVWACARVNWIKMKNEPIAMAVTRKKNETKAQPKTKNRFKEIDKPACASDRLY